MFSIYKKEFKAFFENATGYVVIALFLLTTGLFLWLIPGSMNILDNGYAHVAGLFYLAPWLFLFLIPAITMRSFAEEKQRGTWELLLSKPLRPGSIVMGKYLAALTLAMLALLPTIIYYFSTAQIAEPRGNIDTGEFWGAFIGLFLLAAAYSAIGIFASFLSKSQIVAFLWAVLLCFFFYYGFDLIATFFQGGEQSIFLGKLGIHAHYKSMSRGVIDSRDLGYFFALIIFFLLISWKRVEKRL